MKRSILLFTLPAVILMALLAALFLTAPVYAQDEVPPEVPPEELPEEAPPDELAPVLEEAAEAGVVLADESGEPLPLAEADTAEVLAGGDPYYKVGTTTYHFVFPGECAILYPGEVYPYCQEDPQPIQAAIDYIPTSGLPSDGMIYVEAGNYVELPTIPGYGDPLYHSLKGLIGTVEDGVPQVNLIGDIWVNNVDLGFTIKGFNIIAQANDPFAGIYIMDSAGPVKIEDVAVENGGSGPGIKIVGHNGAVTLNRVRSDYNANGSTYIDNTAGTGGVTITGSSFDHNVESGTLTLSGLTIYTNGSLLIDGVSASDNETHPGLNIGQSGAITIKNSVFNNNFGSNAWGILNNYATTGAVTFSNVYVMGNQAGIYMITKGNLSLTGVHADSNTFQGAMLDTCHEIGSGFCEWLGTGKVTIKDSTFDLNGSSLVGLGVESRGAITLTNVSASGNDNSVTTIGAYLYAHQSQLASAVSVTNGLFNENGDTGLVIQTKGTITLNKVKANGNLNGLGANLNNTYDAVASNVTISGSVLSDNQFEGNDSTGLEINSNGSVLVKYADASDNGGSGLYIDNAYGTGTVSVSKGTFGWWMGGNSSSGIAIYTKGNVTISDVTATGYGSDGIHLFSDSHTNSIKITNGSFFLNGLNGLDIENGGSVTLTNVDAGSNYNLGAEIASWGNILIKDSSFDYNGDHPYDYGLYAYSAQGSIALTNVSVCYSTGVGAFLANQNAASAKPISITGGNFNNNAWTGLQVRSKGAITLKNVNAYENNESNIDIVQPIDRWVREVIDAYETDYITFTPTNATLNIAVSIVDTDFVGEIWLTGCTATTTHYWDDDYNGYVGHNYSDLVPGQVCTLHVQDYYASSGGAYEVAFYDTGGSMIDVTEETYGADLDNTYGTTAGITIINTPIPSTDGPLPYYRDFTMNVAGGLKLHTNGAVVLSNLVLDDNGGMGVFVSNEDGGATYATNVTLSNIYANENYLSGISIFNKGNIVMTNVASWGHMTAGQGYGATMNNTAGTGSVTIKNTIAMPFGFDENHERGLNIFTNGKVSVTNVQLIANDEDGIRVWAGTTGPTSVTLTNVVSNDNNGAGAVIRSFGPIVVTGSTFNDNAIAAHFDNTYSGLTSPKPVTLSKVTAEDNPAGGLEIDTYGAVSMSSVTVNLSNNAGVIGIDINNWQGPYGVTLSKVYSSFSGGAGLNIVTNGAITYKGGELNSNAGDGMTVYAGPEAIARAISLSDLYFHDNQGRGAEIPNKGNITLTNVTSIYNDGFGMSLNNTACGTAAPCSISLLSSGTGHNEFSYNYSGGGLIIDTYGAVVVNKASASSNAGAGLSINNNEALPAKPVNVTITGGTFEQNDGNGLYVRSRGIIKVTGVTVFHNNDGWHGADLSNTEDTTGTKGISVLKSKFNENSDSGLYIRTYGAVLLNTVEASENIASGAYINNNYGLGKSVTVLASYGANKFNHNFADNIVIISNGSVALTNVTGNQSRANDGIDIDNDSGTGTITLTNVTANFNDNNGFNLYTNGNVTIKGITAMLNYGLGGTYSGLYINTHDNAAARVTITSGLITSNGDYGINLDMNITKLYTLTGVFYFGNDSDATGEINLWVH